MKYFVPIILNCIWEMAILLFLFFIMEKIRHKKSVLITAFVMMALLVTAYFNQDKSKIMLCTIVVAVIFTVMAIVYGYEFYDYKMLIIYSVSVIVICSATGMLTGKLILCIVTGIVEMMVLVISIIVMRLKEKFLWGVSSYATTAYLSVVLSLLLNALIIGNNKVLEIDNGYITILIVSIILGFVEIMMIYLIIYIVKTQETIRDNYEYIHNRYEVDKIEIMYDEARKLRHDIKNCIVTAEGFMDEGDNNKAKEYLNEMVDKKVNVFAYSKYCSNRVLNYVINSKATKCRQEGISLKCVVFGKLDEIDDIDLSILIGNLLDNGIEAAAKSLDKKVSLEIFDGRNVEINIENSTKGKVISNNPFFKTTKDDKINHGMGVKSVRDIVEKYSGEIRYEEPEDGMISCKVLLLKKRSVSCQKNTVHAKGIEK